MTVQISSISGEQAALAIDPALILTQLPHAVGNLNILGGLTQHVTVPGSYPYLVLASDNIIAVNTSSTANTINLPATPTTGQTYIIKDATGTASTHNITVSGNGNNIDGASTYVMNVNSQGAAFIFGATQWGVLSASNAIALPLSGANGGTGVANTGSTITLQGSWNNVAATAASASSLTPDSDTNAFYAFTALAAGITINADSGTPYDGKKLIFRFLDNSSPQTITWASGSSGAYEAVGITLPTTTTASKILYVGFIYNANAARWDGVATVVQA